MQCPTRPSTRCPGRAERPGETVVTSTCGHNCGGRCVVNAHVVDDRIVKISTDPAPLAARAAAAARLRPRRRPDRARLSSRPAEIPDAPRRPARRGPVRAHLLGRGARRRSRGEMLRMRVAHGNAAILDASRSGSLSMLHGGGVAKRFFHKFGGCTEPVVQHVGRGRGLRRAHDLSAPRPTTRPPAASRPIT